MQLSQLMNRLGMTKPLPLMSPPSSVSTPFIATVSSSSSSRVQFLQRIIAVLLALNALSFTFILLTYRLPLQGFISHSSSYSSSSSLSALSAFPSSFSFPFLSANLSGDFPPPSRVLILMIDNRPYTPNLAFTAWPYHQLTSAINVIYARVHGYAIQRWEFDFASRADYDASWNKLMAVRYWLRAGRNISISYQADKEFNATETPLYDIIIVMDSDALFVDPFFSLQSMLHSQAPTWWTDEQQALLLSYDYLVNEENKEKPPLGCVFNAGVWIIKNTALSRTFINRWLGLSYKYPDWTKKWPMEQGVLQFDFAAVSEWRRQMGTLDNAVLYGGLYIRHITSMYRPESRLDLVRGAATEFLFRLANNSHNFPFHHYTLTPEDAKIFNGTWPK